MRTKSKGEAHYQAHVNRGGRDRKRERGFNSERQLAMEKVNDKMVEAVDGKFPVTKQFVIELMEQHGALNAPLSEKAKDETYKHFKYVFGWTNRKFGSPMPFSRQYRGANPEVGTPIVYPKWYT